MKLTLNKIEKLIKKNSRFYSGTRNYKPIQKGEKSKLAVSLNFIKCKYDKLCDNYLYINGRGKLRAREGFITQERRLNRLGAQLRMILNVV